MSQRQSGVVIQSERERIGPYVLVKAIGAGGSARVDLARIERAYGFQRHVVVKRPLEHLRADPRAADSIRREARLGGRLRHPNLIAILDAGVHDGYDYLVLEYVHGGSLRTLMQADEASRVRDVSLEVALTIVRDVARGVHEAHELKDERGASLGLVHRDVSPGNVLVGLDGAVKLADFGIAKETRVATLSGSMHGTVTYMAPEQCRGHAFDRRADVFSIGVILYELITGTRLFWADNDVASLHRVLEGNVIRPRRVRANVPSQLEELIMASLAVEQDKRVATARALADTIESYASETGLILAARGVSRWSHELLGPRDAPLVGDHTVVEIALPVTPPTPEPSGSLVELIESTPIPQMLPLPTFGPTDAALREDVGTGAGIPYAAAAPAQRKRRGAVIAGVLGASLAIGGAVALVTAQRASTPTARHEEPAASPTPAPAPAPAPQPAPPTAPPTATEPPIAAEPPPAQATEPAAAPPVDPEPEPDPEPKAPHNRVRRHVTRHVVKTTDKAQTGSATKSHGNVEWDPKILMPTDTKKKH